MGYDKRAKVSFTVPVSTSTFTASDHVLTQTTVFRQPLARACNLLGGVGSVTTAGASKLPQCVIMQSTNTGLNIPTSHTLGANSGVKAVTQPGSDYAAGDQLLVNVISTGTASAAQVNPVWEIELDIAEKFG